MSLTALVASLRRRRGGPAVTAGRPAIGGPAADLVGLDPQGRPLHVPVARQPSTLLFLTSTCVGCRPLWRSLGNAPTSVVIVTPDPSTESRRGVAALAPRGVVTVMSSAGWHDYGVVGAPWRVEVRDGAVVAHGPATADIGGAGGALEAGGEPADGRVRRPTA